MTPPTKNSKLDSKTIAYEFWMLCGTAKRLSTTDKEQDQILFAALVESFAIHCRALLTFFFGKDKAKIFRPPSDNDVVVQDFCQNWSEQWASHDSDYRLAKLQADKHIAHITTERQGINLPNGGKSEWNAENLMPHFHRLMREFLQTAPMGALDEEARSMLENLLPKRVSIQSHPVMPTNAGGTGFTTDASTPSPYREMKRGRS